MPKGHTLLEPELPLASSPLGLCERRPQCELQCNGVLVILQDGEVPLPLPSSVLSIWLPMLTTVTAFRYRPNSNTPF